MAGQQAILEHKGLVGAAHGGLYCLRGTLSAFWSRVAYQQASASAESHRA
jgi:hypothetical protein